MDVYKGREIGEPRKTSLGLKVVLKLLEPFQKRGRNITSDNFYKFGIGKKAFNAKSHHRGNISKEQKRSSCRICVHKGPKRIYSLYGFQKKVMIASY